MSSTADGDWICVRTQPRRETWAKQNIEQRHGLAVILPLLREQVAKGQHIVRPLFPSYLFTCIRNQQWYFLFSTFGVLGPLIRGESPEWIPPKVIDGLQKHLDKDGCYEAPRFRKGQALSIKRGPFQGLVGVYEGMSPNERCCVLLDLMGREVKANLSLRDVVAQAA